MHYLVPNRVYFAGQRRPERLDARPGCLLHRRAVLMNLGIIAPYMNQLDRASVGFGPEIAFKNIKNSTNSLASLEYSRD